MTETSHDDSARIRIIPTDCEGHERGDLWVKVGNVKSIEENGKEAWMKEAMLAYEEFNNSFGWTEQVRDALEEAAREEGPEHNSAEDKASPVANPSADVDDGRLIQLFQDNANPVIDPSADVDDAGLIQLFKENGKPFSTSAYFRMSKLLQRLYNLADPVPTALLKFMRGKSQFEACVTPTTYSRLDELDSAFSDANALKERLYTLVTTYFQEIEDEEQTDYDIQEEVNDQGETVFFDQE